MDASATTENDDDLKNLLDMMRDATMALRGVKGLIEASDGDLNFVCGYGLGANLGLICAQLDRFDDEISQALRKAGRLTDAPFCTSGAVESGVCDHAPDGVGKQLGSKQ